MRRSFTAALLSGAAALTLGIGATTAMAGTTHAAATKTWTITPGGAVTGTAKNPTLKDTATGTTLKCATSSTSATLKSGSKQKNPIGEITSVTFSNCTGPDGLTFTATTSASPSNPYPLTAKTYKSPITTGSIGNITASVSGTGCTLTVAGTSATSPGEVTGKYSNTTHKLTTSGGNLHVYNVSGCFGLINTGDPSTFSGVYTISPAQTITSP